MRNRSIGCGVLVLLIGAGIAWMFLSTQRPSDADLIAHFKARKAAFEVLRTMLNEEPASIVGLDGGSVIHEEMWKRVSYYKAGMTDERYQHYQQIMGDIGARQLWRDDDDQEFHILSGWWGYGFGGTGQRLSYCYLENPPPNQVKTLEEIHAYRRKAKGMGHRLLAAGR